MAFRKFRGGRSRRRSKRRTRGMKYYTVARGGIRL